jgi:AraC family transcriptional regulator of adaptative response/methylated-DNA-[protein]-cysteine methyltransferase
VVVAGAGRDVSAAGHVAVANQSRPSLIGAARRFLSGLNSPARIGARLTARVERLLDAPSDADGLQLELRGDGFQQKIWQTLRAIPAGSTESYAEVARRIGPPASAKDVAEACAANPIAVAIPCHRVVRSDGSISGYRWGVRRKRALLAREARP